MATSVIRLLHVVSSALMFGVGVGAFWFMVTTVRSGNPGAIAIATRNAVRAEWFIAAPVAIVQPVTGYLLMRQLDYPLRSDWFYAVAALYIAAGMCWVYLVKAELKMRAIAAAHGTSLALPGEFGLLFRRWTWLAAGSFAGVLSLFWLMVFRPGL